jgi:hypothetical protein
MEMERCSAFECVCCLLSPLRSASIFCNFHHSHQYERDMTSKNCRQKKLILLHYLGATTIDVELERWIERMNGISDVLKLKVAGRVAGAIGNMKGEILAEDFCDCCRNDVSSSSPSSISSLTRLIAFVVAI